MPFSRIHFEDRFSRGHRQGHAGTRECDLECGTVVNRPGVLKVLEMHRRFGPAQFGCDATSGVEHGCRAADVDLHVRPIV